MIPRNLILSVIVMILIAGGMGFYVWRMRSRVEAVPAVTALGAPVAAPVAGAPEQISLFVAYDDTGVLKAQSYKIPLPAGRQPRAQEVLRYLISIYDAKPSPHPLGAGSDVRSVYLVDPDLAVIDLNAAFASGHASGVLVEELTVASLVESLSANVPGIRRVKILVDGKAQETLAGHADLTAFYDVGATHELALALGTSQ